VIGPAGVIVVFITAGGNITGGGSDIDGFPEVILPLLTTGPVFHSDVTVSKKRFISSSNLVCSLHF